MTLESFLATVRSDGVPPQGLSSGLEALWHAKAGHWDRAHEIAQDIPTKTGSWIHGLLHAIEGDFGNSAYWYCLAGRDPICREQIEAEWERIVAALL